MMVTTSWTPEDRAAKENRVAAALFEDCFPGLGWSESDPGERGVWLRQAKIAVAALDAPRFMTISSTVPGGDA